MIHHISEGKNHTAINIGSLNNLSDHSFLHPKLGHTVESKVFVGEALKTNGSEISFAELQPKTTIKFLHKHKEHEEIYIFLRGEGQFQIDDELLPINEGSVIRVSPDGSRTLRNDSDYSMRYLVIQAKAGTLRGYDISDGYRVEGEIKI